MAAYNICVQLGVFMLHGGSRLAVVVVVLVVIVVVELVVLVEVVYFQTMGRFS